MKTAIIDSLTCIDIIDQNLEINDIQKYFLELSEHNDSEIKLYATDIKEYVASFNWKGINQWKVDCPVTLHKIHRQRYATGEECIILIKKVYQFGDLDNEDNFIDVPISHFTLDEMIEFKQEDNMMLKGLDSDTDNSISNSTKKTESIKNKSLPKKTTSKPLQQSESSISKANVPNKGKSITKSVSQKGVKPTGNNSLFSI